MMDMGKEYEWGCHQFVMTWNVLEYSVLYEFTIKKTSRLHQNNNNKQTEKIETRKGIVGPKFFNVYFILVRLTKSLKLDRVSVSRAIKPFAEPGRPPDWFSQKVWQKSELTLLQNTKTKCRISAVVLLHYRFLSQSCSLSSFGSSQHCASKYTELLETTEAPKWAHKVTYPEHAFVDLQAKINHIYIL